MRKLLIILIGLLFVMSCSPKIIQGSAKTIKEVVRDTTIIVQPDSAYYQAWVECRDNKPVLIKKEQITVHDTVFIAKKGKYLQVPKVQLNGNVLRVESKADKQEVKAKIKEKTTVEVRTVVKEVEKRLSWWQTLFIWTGVIFWIVLLAVISLKLSPFGGILKSLTKFIKNEKR